MSDLLAAACLEGGQLGDELAQARNPTQPGGSLRLHCEDLRY